MLIKQRSENENEMKDYSYQEYKENVKYFSPFNYKDSKKEKTKPKTGKFFSLNNIENIEDKFLDNNNNMFYDSLLQKLKKENRKSIGRKTITTNQSSPNIASPKKAIKIPKKPIISNIKTKYEEDLPVEVKTDDKKPAEVTPQLNLNKIPIPIPPKKSIRLGSPIGKLKFKSHQFEEDSVRTDNPSISKMKKVKTTLPSIKLGSNKKDIELKNFNNEEMLLSRKKTLSKLTEGGKLLVHAKTRSVGIQKRDKDSISEKMKINFSSNNLINANDSSTKLKKHSKFNNIPFVSQTDQKELKSGISEEHMISNSNNSVINLDSKQTIKAMKKKKGKCFLLCCFS